MNITTADSLIQSHFNLGLINTDIALKAQNAIRDPFYCRQTGDARERLLRERFDISNERIESLALGQRVIASLHLPA